MRIASFGNLHEQVPAVSVEPGRWKDLRTVVVDLGPAAIEQLMALDDATIARLPEIDTRGLRVGAPVMPGKIICVGLNYRDHAEESGAEVPEEPILFMKGGHTVVGAYDAVRVPKDAKKVDYEAELAVVIGRTAEYLESPEAAREHVLGFSISNDVSEREFQLERGGQWDKGKNCATFNPLGPWITTRGDVPDVQGLRVRLWVNDEVRQDGNTREMVFDPYYLVYYISQFMPLLPGDVINTGTPAGVGLGRVDGYLRPGDDIRISIDRLGTQRQMMV